MPSRSRTEELVARAEKLLAGTDGDNAVKAEAWDKIKQATTEAEYLAAVDASSLSRGAKLRLKETI